MTAAFLVRRSRPALLAIAGGLLLGATPAPHPAPVTLVARPWATASLDGGDPFVIPSTVLLESGEYRLTITREGYVPMETTLRVEGSEPHHRFFRLERR